MSTAHNPIRLFETVVDDCPYLANEKSASIIVDPDHKVDLPLFSMLSRSGFRRSGAMLYAPNCPSCKACISVRIPAKRFKMSRSQKRVWKKNKDLHTVIEDVGFDQSQFDLYLRYQQHRHPESTMCDTDPKKYTGFIESPFAQSKFLCFYHEKQLIGVCVIDQFTAGISAVYTFFEPTYADRSLGTYAILYLLYLARRHDVPYIYLGYWVENSEKMAYKTNFKPIQGYVDRQWVEL